MPRMFDFRIDEPPTPENGKGWVNPVTGQAQVYINGAWIPFAGGAPATVGAGPHVFIQGVDRTSLIRKGTLKIKDQLTSRVDSCDFVLQDSDGNARPQRGNEVVIYRGSPAQKIFAGLITQAPQSQMGIGVYKYAVKALDYQQLLRKRLVVQSYTSQTCRQIIQDLIDTYVPELTINNVQDGPNIAFISWNYKTVEQAIKELAGVAGFDWYVDYELDLHFFKAGTMTSPFDLTEPAGNANTWWGLRITVDKTQLRNRVYVRGGYELSSLYTQEIEADGEQLDFPISYEPFAPIGVEVNSVAKTVGIDNVDDSGFDFVVNTSEKVLKNLDHAKLSAGDVVTLTYKYRIPILVAADDVESQEAVRGFEGGDGVYEGPVIVDRDISDREAARDRARAELQEFANPLVSGSFETDIEGFRSGQLITVTLPGRDFSGQYMIRQVSKKSLGVGVIISQVNFATRLKGLADFLAEMFDRGREVFRREDEVLDEIVDIDASSVLLSDGTPTYEEQTPPYQYGPGGSPQGVWNESQWG